MKKQIIFILKDWMTKAQRVRYLLTVLRKKDLITNIGCDTKLIWVLK